MTWMNEELQTQIFLLLPSVSGKALVTDGCAQGPEFWCQDLVSATQCGAVDHCKDTVWKNGLDPLCLECQQMVSIFIGMVKSSSLQGSVKTYLHNQCNRYPLVLIHDQCKDLVDQYEGAFVTMLIHLFDPKAVCAKINLCPKEPADDRKPELLRDPRLLENILTVVHDHVQTLHSKMTQSTNEDLPIPKPLCFVCKTFISQIQKAIPKKTIAKVGSELCLVLPSMVGGLCQCLVEKYVVIILDMLLGKAVPKMVCGLILLCARQENCMADVTYDGTCETCLEVTNMVKPTASQNVTQEQIVKAMSGVCPVTLSWEECHAFMEEHQKQLSLLLLKPWDHMTTCQVLGACPGTPKVISEETGCAAGPSYWCKSLDHAKECNAIGHCLENIWH
ncbi:pulmonary surfactant-associated protein B [Gastrophryne carolinensis]